MRNLLTRAAPRAKSAGPLAVFLLLFVAVGPARASRAAAQTIPLSAYAGMRWRSIGPNRSGNVYAVAGVPHDPTVYYLGLPEGGVWKTTDGGTVWKPIFDQEHVPSIGAVVVSPSEPNVVYAGTGDPTGWSYTPGKGVYKSTDAGRTWTNVGLDSTRYIDAMLVSPTDPNDVLAGSYGSRQRGGGSSAVTGVFRSTDGGQTWTRTLYVDAYTGVTGLTRDYSDPQVVYASVERTAFRLPPAERKELEPIGVGIFRSTDGGATWKPVAGKGLPETARGFEIAAASGTQGERLYAEAQGTGRDAGGVYRSDDGGATWTLGTHRIASAGGRIYVDPTNPDVVYLMGTSMYRSVNGARSFVSYKGSPGGDDDRDMWIDPVNGKRMIIGADQGPTISVDGGKTWTPWYNLVNGQFYNVFTDNQFPYHVCGSQQDSGTACVLSRSDFGEIRQSDWWSAAGFEASAVLTDPLHPYWVYAQGWYHVVQRLDRRTNQVAVLYSPTPEDRFLWLPPMAFSPQDPHTLYVGAQWVLASNDNGITWHHISPDLTVRPGSGRRVLRRPGAVFGASIQALEPSPVAAGEIWVGTTDGLIQLTRDGGTTWTNVTPPDMPRGTVNFIDASHSDAGTAYAAIEVPGDGAPWIFRTSDFGRTWQKIVDGLPADAGVRVVREDPVDPNLLYAGTVTGAWVSFDRGDHWQSLQLNLPTTPVTDMTVHGADLDISTYGRGLWILDDVTPLRQAAEAVAAGGPYLFRPDTTYRVRWDNYQDTPLPPEVPAGQNPPEGAILDYYLPQAASGTVTLSVYDRDGGLIRRYTSVAPAPDTTMKNVPSYWIQPPVVLGTSAGEHRIAWDLRYTTPLSLNYGYYGGILDFEEYTLTWHAIKGHTPGQVPTGPIVVPGTYRVELTADGHTYSRNLTVVNDPRDSVSQADLVDQLAFERRMMAGLKASYDGFNSVQTLRDTLAADITRMRPGSLARDAKALDKKLDALQFENGHAFGPANRDLARHLEQQEFGDIKPTPSDLAAGELDCRETDASSAALTKLVATELPRLNRALSRAHLATLPAVQAPPSPACTLPGGSSSGM